jgi:hypothetical protein
MKDDFKTIFFIGLAVLTVGAVLLLLQPAEKPPECCPVPVQPEPGPKPKNP